MTQASEPHDLLRAFEAQRTTLLALSYRMLGDFQRAEDMVQDAWLGWQRNTEPVHDAKAYLITTVTRLCLNELSSARVRCEQARAISLISLVLSEGKISTIFLHADPERLLHVTGGAHA
jgi:DNA-directed RNA polymerase specialized sigma24 family protein